MGHLGSESGAIPSCPADLARPAPDCGPVVTLSAETDGPAHPPVQGPLRADGLLHAAAEQIHEMFGVHRQLDKLLYESAKQVGGVEFESIFNPISTEQMSAKPRPGA